MYMISLCVFFIGKVPYYEILLSGILYVLGCFLGCIRQERNCCERGYRNYW